MARDDLVQRAAQRSDVQRTGQPDRRRDVVERASWLELVQEPHTLLPVGHGEDDQLVEHVLGSRLRVGHGQIKV